MVQRSPVHGPLFLTGASGFIGTRVLAALARTDDRLVRCLVRAGAVAPGLGGSQRQIVRGDLETPDSYVSALPGAHVVLHLAGKVGRGRPDEHRRVNVEGTRALVQACRQAGVDRFVYVSSIAATFRDKTAYHYAVSKWEAEEAVRASGLRYAIVRPTVVLGHGSPAWNKLARLAALPLIPVFGDGQVRVQPIHVDDVAECLVWMLDDPLLSGREIDLGGPDVLSLEELLRRICRAQRGKEARVVHLPARQTIRTLAWLERWVGDLLPITAGQLAPFVNDSTARPDPSLAARMPRMRTLDEMLTLLTTHG